MAEEELQMEEGGKKKSKLLIIIIAVVVLVLGGGAAYYFLMGSDEPAQTEEMMDGEVGDAGEYEDGEALSSSTVKTGSALYVGMPRPFVFNVPGSTRDRLVEIKVQLMMRGSDNEEEAKMHIPLIEGALLRTFSTANADDLVTEAGKIAIRDSALKEVQKTLVDITGNKVVEEVLFTGFVMQ
ncbi:flagellar basal body-associated protein FliL [Paraglaciecola aquimarina]|uniref:Flagellar protein FliL n=1 Tax=Paraglaciecola algarum TaxID=3050085 RepID=A0ABS9DDW5_9ALTE|nr:flagellar basal body-associated protein FliL [Paraglaciecola sp. G1-23]MCF2950212.1 flagellar basal body-associated protein FliL [Paraglaciecola sp. G1-23]